MSERRDEESTAGGLFRKAGSSLRGMAQTAGATLGDVTEAAGKVTTTVVKEVASGRAPAAALRGAGQVAGAATQATFEGAAVVADAVSPVLAEVVESSRKAAIFATHAAALTALAAIELQCMTQVLAISAVQGAKDTVTKVIDTINREFIDRALALIVTEASERTKLVAKVRTNLEQWVKTQGVTSPNEIIKHAHELVEAEINAWRDQQVAQAEQGQGQRPRSTSSGYA